MTMQKVAEALEEACQMLEDAHSGFGLGDSSDNAWRARRDKHVTAGDEALAFVRALIRSDAQGERGAVREEMMDCYQFGTISAAPSTPSPSDWEAGAEAMREAIVALIEFDRALLPDDRTFEDPTAAGNAILSLPIPRRP